MKHTQLYSRTFFFFWSGLFVFLLLVSGMAIAQTEGVDSLTNTPVRKYQQVKNTFESNLIIDDQSVMVPSKNTLEFDILHRFGIINNGYSNFYGLFAPPVIRLGFEYVPINNLQIGFGLCSNNMDLDLNGKYAIVKQSRGAIPVSVTYYGNIVIDTRSSSDFVERGDRLSYFNQLMVARKINSKLSVQTALSLSHFNNVPGYTDAEGVIRNTVMNDQFTWSLMGRYKLTEKMAILVDYDQPLTQNPTNNPHPNVAFGLEITTSSHCFQIIAGNGQYILPQLNAMNNQNDFSKGQYLLGFNMTKLWNF